MYLNIIFLPLFSSIVAGLFGRFLGSTIAANFTITCIILTFLTSCFAFYEVNLHGSPCYISLFSWIDSEFFSLNWGFMFDSLTCVMLIVVTSISSFVHIYSTEYMKADPHLARFMSYLSFFTFFMIMLVTADNFLQMFLGWEGVGLCSYLLINFWYGRLQANKAALKAMIINRIGDFGLAIAIFTMYFVFQSIDYSTIFALIPEYQNKTFLFFGLEFNIITFVCIFLFIGCMGKSAQIGLHTWLPDAMEGPTPVSALIHAATMVTAGVFLIARCSPIFEYSDTALSVVTILGAMTAFLAASTGLMQNDLKRVIAYSTCSQLGYMIFACGISGYNIGIFHLANHAFFKALLFLSAGSVIHAMSDEQDMRKMGGLLKLLPYTYGMMLIGSLALMGFPFLTGFYSKDVILELAYGSFTLKGHFAHWLGTISAFFTAFYSIRLLALTFLRPTNALKNTVEHIHESSFKMAFPLYVLAFCSIFIGYVTRDMMIGLGSDFWGNAIYIAPQNLFILEAEWIDSSIKLIPLIFSLSGMSLAFILYNFYYNLIVELNLTATGLAFYNFLNRKWFFDKVYNEFITQNVLNACYTQTYQNMDRGIIELMGPHGLSTMLASKSNTLTNINLGFLFSYIFIILFAVVLLLFILGFWYICISFINPFIILLTFLIVLFS